MCKSTVLVVAAVGTSGSGKTTTLEYLISHFSADGYRVGAIKHIHHEEFSIDKEGTNTWRYAKAGSEIIVAVAPKEIDIIKKTKNELEDLDKIIELLEKENLKVIFIEGFHKLIAKKKSVLKIICAKDYTDLERTLEGTLPPILGVTGLITQNTDELKFGDIPIIKVPQHGEKLTKTIKEHIEKQEKS